MGEMNWFQCKDKCEDQGLDMLCIEDHDQNEFIYTTFSHGKEVSRVVRFALRSGARNAAPKHHRRSNIRTQPPLDVARDYGSRTRVELAVARRV